MRAIASYMAAQPYDGVSRQILIPTSFLDTDSAYQI